MAHYEIIIETSETEHGYKADVVRGPQWAKDAGSARGYVDAACAFRTARARINDQAPRRDTFDFLHVHA